MIATIGNGLYAHTKQKLSLLDEYRRKQAKCSHAKRDPRGMCYACGHQQKAVKPVCLQVDHICPPVPTNECDWQAYVSEREEGVVGYGPTREAAVANLMEQIEEAR